MKRLLMILVLSGFGHAQTPALPNFVDNNELTCLNTSQCTAGSPALTTPYTYPTYEYTLGTSTGSLPGACTWAGSYAATASGLQSAIGAVEACRTQQNLCGILDLPAASSPYNITSSILIPQTNTTGIHASCPIIVRTDQFAALEALPEPVGSGGIQQNLPESSLNGCEGFTCIGLRNPSLDGINANSLSVECPAPPGPPYVLAYQLGMSTFCIPQGTFTLANGAVITTSNYNYLQYMAQLVATGSTGPMQFCSVAPGQKGTSQICNYPSTLPQFGPDLWYFEGIVFSEQSGNHNNMDLVSIGNNGGNETSVSQYASHIHFRRDALLGDWTNLTAGSNQIATGWAVSQCFYCSVVGSSATQLLRPGGEGHVANFNGELAKFSDNWFEGQSSCIFSGGGNTAFDITPVGSFISNQDVEHRRTRCTFPLAWLGQASGNVSDSNPYWGGAGDNPIATVLVNVDTTGLSVTYSLSNPVGTATFHDSTSFWPGNNVFINGATSGCWNGTKAVKCTIASIGPGSFPSSPPTTLTLSNPICNIGCTGGSTVGLTNVSFLLNGAGIVRKNCDEKKSGLRYLYSGNIDENVDNSGGQRGICLVLSTRNTSGGGQGTNYQDKNADFNIQNSIFQNTCEANTLGANSASSGGNGGGVAASAERISFYNNASLNVTHSNPGCPSGSSVGFQINIPFQTWIGTVTENSLGNQATIVGSASIEAGSTLPQCPPTCPNVPLVADTVTYNSFSAHQLTVNASRALTDYVVNETVHFPCAGCAGDPGTGGGSELQNSDFVILSSTGSTLTVGLGSSSIDPGSLNAGTQLQGPAGFQVFNIGAGFPVFLSNCSDSSFNTATSAIGPISPRGSDLWNGSWTTGNVTVTFPWTATANSAATCTISNVQGRPNNFYFQKNLMVTDAPSVFGTGNAPNSGGTPFSLNGGIQDNILLNSVASAGNAGWFNSAATLGEGNITEVFQFDKNTLTASNLLIPRPFGSAALYTEYCNNPVIPNGPSNCTNNSSPAPHMYFPCSNGYPCTSGGTYASCQVGFLNVCTGNISLALADYHLYGLAPLVLGLPNPFYTLSSSGGQLGPDFAAIDAAQIANTYIPMVMGQPVSVSVGPFPDNLSGSPAPTSPTAPAAKVFASLSGGTK